MSNQVKAWYYTQTSSYYAWIEGKKTKLLKGRKTRRNLKLAEEPLEDVLQERAFNARFNVRVEKCDQTVASVLGAYQEHAKGILGRSTREIRFACRQSFAEGSVS